MPAEALPPGQRAVVAGALRALRRGRLAQAQLIVGPADSGGEAVAEALAMALFCLRPDAAGWPCGDCRGCRSVRGRTHPDLHWLGSEGKLGIDEARGIAAAAQVRPSAGTVSVFVVEACERLTGPAAAALLKTLEDPPGPALFLLVANAPDQMEPTLRSRCLPLRLRPLPVPELAVWLEEHLPALGPPEALALARRAGGWPARALKLAGRDAPQAEAVGPLVAGLLAADGAAAAASAAALAPADLGPEAALAVLRDALVCRSGLAATIPGMSAVGEGQAAEVAAAYAGVDWGGCLQACLEAMEAAEANVNGILNWQVLFIRLRRLRGACYASDR